jgi:MerR family transcriptional regulator, thiopeptide resistance regulator
MTEATDRHWRVGELARMTGLTVRALHHYDEIGLLRPQARSFAGYRLYGERDLRRLYRIVALRRLGLPLEEIAAVLDGDEGGLSITVHRHLEAVEAELAQLARLRDRLIAVRDVLLLEGEPSIDQLTTTMEAMAMLERHYTPDQLKRLKARADALGGEGMQAAQDAWAEIYDALRAAMEAGTDPADPSLEPQRARARELIAAFTGGEADIAASLQRAWCTEDPEELSHGLVDRELATYAGRVFAA